MDIKYNIEEIYGQTVIWYEKDGVRYSFGTNPDNSDYQAYLKSLEAKQSTPIVTEE
jgi:hypothetical protein